MLDSSCFQGGWPPECTHAPPSCGGCAQLEKSLAQRHGMSSCICAAKERRRCSHTSRQSGLHQEEIVVQKGISTLFSGWGRCFCPGYSPSLMRWTIVCSIHQPPLDTSECFDGLLLLKHTAVSGKGIRKTVYNDIAETDSASLHFHVSAGQWHSTMLSYRQVDHLGNLHPVVQVLESHGHGLERQHHALSFQLLPTPKGTAHINTLHPST